MINFKTTLGNDSFIIPPGVRTIFVGLIGWGGSVGLGDYCLRPIQVIRVPFTANPQFLAAPANGNNFQMSRFEQNNPFGYVTNGNNGAGFVSYNKTKIVFDQGNFGFRGRGGAGQAGRGDAYWL